MNSYFEEENKKINRPTQRLFWSALVGIIFNAYIYAALDRGVYLYFAPNDSSQWNNIFWDDWLLRIIAIIISSSIGSIIAGVIARRRGKIVGIISIIPSLLFWLYILYCLKNNQLDLNIFNTSVMPASTSIISILLAVLVNIFAGFSGGWLGEKFSSRLANEFDSRKYTLLGIKWYNYLWYPLVIYLILIEAFFIASYGYERIKILFSLPEFSLSSIFINALSFPALIGLVLIYFSFVGSYQILANTQDYVNTTKGKIILFGLLITLVPAISFGLTYLSFYLESLFR